MAQPFDAFASMRVETQRIGVGEIATAVGREERNEIKEIKERKERKRWCLAVLKPRVHALDDQQHIRRETPKKGTMCSVSLR
jgi:hypothetical protein